MPLVHRVRAVASRFSVAHERRQGARMVDRPLTVEDGTGAGLGRQVEAAQKLRVERYDDRRQ